ncbi:MLO-like protein 10 [Acorus calamus]|uniref:MLO-like protein 10 n=1 Tax=Acorus calamus TaxID=4465 RepID=A0AAV9D7E7_ACOCL|nr:MLO-like protein 10 [Acorus calamus]
MNVHGWQALFWVAFFPLIIILAVGTKLQAIITQMALEINERHAVVQGIPLVQLSDNHFWFGSPQLVLILIHFTLFQNAFQITYFFWIWYEFGLKSCFHDNFKVVIARVCLGVLVQFLCSYITLPLYALVSQMGTHLKKSIFDEQTSRALKKWRKDAKKNQGKPSQGSRTPGGGTLEASPSTSPVHPLQRFNTGSKKSRKYFSDPEFDTPESASVLIQTGSHEAAMAEERHDGDDFSFSKPPIV